MNLSSRIAAAAFGAAVTVGVLGASWASAQEEPTTTAPPAAEAPAEEAPDPTAPPRTKPGCEDRGTGGSSGGSSDSTEQAPTASQTRFRVRSL